MKKKAQSIGLSKILGCCKSLSESSKKVLILFIVVRALASFAALIGYATVPSNPVVPAEGYSKPSYPRFIEATAGVWERSDALWYIHIAKDGYRPGSDSAVFMPLYPALIKVLHVITGLPWLICALIISNASFLCALYFLYRLVEIEWGAETAERTIWYEALFPGSLFMLAPYTESLYLGLVTGAFWAARSRKWWIAGIAGALVGVTRPVGVLLIVPLIAEFLRQRFEKPPVMLRQAAWIFLVPVGFLLLLAFWAKLSGNALAFAAHQKSWQRELWMPWNTIAKSIQDSWAFLTQYPGGIYTLEMVTVFLAIIVGIIALRRIPVPYSLFLWMGLLPPLFLPFPGRPLLSIVRFIAVLFPVFITLAILAREKEPDNAIRVIFAGTYGLSVALYVASQNMF